MGTDNNGDTVWVEVPWVELWRAWTLANERGWPKTTIQISTKEAERKLRACPGDGNDVVKGFFALKQKRNRSR